MKQRGAPELCHQQGLSPRMAVTSAMFSRGFGVDAPHCLASQTEELFRRHDFSEKAAVVFSPYTEQGEKK